MENLAESSNSQVDKPDPNLYNDFVEVNEPKTTNSEASESEEKSEQTAPESDPSTQEGSKETEDKVSTDKERQDLCESDLKRYRVYAAEEDEKELKDAVLKHLEKKKQRIKERSTSNVTSSRASIAVASSQLIRKNSTGQIVEASSSDTIPEVDEGFRRLSVWQPMKEKFKLKSTKDIKILTKAELENN